MTDSYHVIGQDSTSGFDARCKNSAKRSTFMYRGLARDVRGHVIHRKPPSLGASGSSFVRRLGRVHAVFRVTPRVLEGTRPLISSLYLLYSIIEGSKLAQAASGEDRSKDYRISVPF